MINKQSYIRKETQVAINVLMELFTADQKEILAIKNGDIRVELIEQLIARWWYHLPIIDNPLILKGRAAKVIATHKHLIELIDKADKENIMAKLIDPDNHKRVSDTEFEFKRANKANSTSESNMAGLTRILGKTLGGQSGISETYQYSSQWDANDRKRLDAIKLELARVSSLEWTNPETGKEDHMEDQDWLKQTESVENARIKRETGLPPGATLEETLEYEKTMKQKWFEADKKAALTGIKEDTKLRTQFSGTEKEEKALVDSMEAQDLNIHEATISQSTNVTASEEAKNSLSYSDTVNRGKGNKSRKDYSIADVIYKIQSLEFVDLREQLYRKFDPFFKYEKSRPCL